MGWHGVIVRHAPRPRYYSVADAARVLGAHPATVRRWLLAARLDAPLPSDGTGPRATVQPQGKGRRYRLSLATFEALLRALSLDPRVGVKTRRGR